MFTFVGETNIQRILIYKAKVEYLVANAHINTTDFYGECSIDTIKEDETICRRYKIKFDFGNFRRMIEEHEWIDFDLMFKVNLNKLSTLELCEALNVKSVLVRLNDSENNIYSEYSKNSLKSEDDYKTDIGFIDFSKCGNICLFLGDSKQPKYSLIIKKVEASKIWKVLFKLTYLLEDQLKRGNS